MTTTTMPTKGVARRRAKAVRNRESADESRFFIDGTIPRHAVAVDMCPCGRVAWLGRNASDEEREGFDRDSEDHEAYCDGGLS